MAGFQETVQLSSSVRVLSEERCSYPMTYLLIKIIFETYTKCFDPLVAMFSFCIVGRCNRFTCNIYVITVAFCQL